MNCAICNNTTSIRYQCCSNDKHSLCESCCVNMITSIIDNGKIGLLFNKKIPCYTCNKKFQYNHLPESIQLELNNIYLTIPKTSIYPKLIKDFNYYYNDLNQLRHCITNKKFSFITQRHYDLLGKTIELYIQSLIKSNIWNYGEIWLPIEKNSSNGVNIFVSNDFRINNNGCLILIQGSGAVRAGQWARSCCINKSLDIGAMFPYMLKAKEHNLSVIILNPNQTSYINEEEPLSLSSFSESDIVSYYLSSDPLPYLKSKSIPDLSTSYKHILYVYDNIISKYSPAKHFYIVAHSAGGDNLMYLLRKRQDNILSKLSKIAFIDSIHSISLFDTTKLTNFLKLNAIHFLASNKSMNEIINSSDKSICLEVSAGHIKHEYTSGYCIKGVFNFFFSSYILIKIMFGKKPTVAEQAKAHSRELKKTDRELVRDRHKLDAEEQRLTNEIRKNATTGNKKAVEILAKQLVKVRNQKAQSLQASGHIQGLATQNTMLASNVRMANAMETTAKTMAKMNKVINPEEMSKVTQQFTQEHTKLGLTDEIINETLEAALGEDGDEEEEDAIVNQVLDEIGISLNEKMANAPRVPTTASSVTANRRQANQEDDETERMLANLKSA